MPVITRPGESDRDDPVLAQAYRAQDIVVEARLWNIVHELDAFARWNKSVACLGFDAGRYQALERDARQTATELHRALERWSTTTS